MDKHQVVIRLNDGTVDYCDLPQNLCGEKSVIIAAIQNNIDNVKYIPKFCYDDFEIMLTAVKIDGMLLAKVSKRLIQNYYIVLAAVTQNGKALKFVFDHEIDYHDEYEEEYDSHGEYKRFVGRHVLDVSRQNLIDKKNIVIAAVKNYGFALEFASSRLKADKEVVLEAIKKHGTALEFASIELRKDKELITNAIRSNPHVIYSSYIPSLLKNLFSVFSGYSLNEKMNYLFEKIKDGSLLPYSVYWLRKIPNENCIQLMDWIGLNMYDYKKLFNVMFYKSRNFNSNKRLGYFRNLPRLFLSFLVPEQNVIQKQKVILNDILSEYQYYV